jgi:GxxExxY protein
MAQMEKRCTDDCGKTMAVVLIRCRRSSRIEQVWGMTTQNDPLTHEIIAAAIAVSKYWGNGVLENIYKKSLAHELRKRGFSVETEVPIPCFYDDLQFEIAFRADIIVNRSVILEAKAITATLPVHRAQLLTYMRLSGLAKGLLINFHAYPFTKGITRLSL